MERVIIWDFSGVMTTQTFTTFLAENFHNRWGLDTAKVKQLLYKHEFPYLTGDKKEGAYATYWRRTIPELQALTDRELPDDPDFYNSIFATIPANEDVIRLIQFYAQQGVKQVLFTDNYPEIIAAYNSRYDNEGTQLFELFALQDISYEVGKTKKMEGRYEDFIGRLKAAGIDPTKCILIDDKQKNLDVIREYGVHGILFEDYDKLIAKLQELGFPIPPPSAE